MESPPGLSGGNARRNRYRPQSSPSTHQNVQQNRPSTSGTQGRDYRNGKSNLQLDQVNTLGINGTKIPGRKKGKWLLNSRQQHRDSLHNSQGGGNEYSEHYSGDQQHPRAYDVNTLDVSYTYLNDRHGRPEPIPSNNLPDVKRPAPFPDVTQIPYNTHRLGTESNIQMESENSLVHRGASQDQTVDELSNTFKQMNLGSTQQTLDIHDFKSRSIKTGIDLYPTGSKGVDVQHKYASVISQQQEELDKLKAMHKEAVDANEILIKQNNDEEAKMMANEKLLNQTLKELQKQNIELSDKLEMLNGEREFELTKFYTLITERREKYVACSEALSFAEVEKCLKEIINENETLKVKCAELESRYNALSEQNENIGFTKESPENKPYQQEETIACLDNMAHEKDNCVNVIDNNILIAQPEHVLYSDESNESVASCDKQFKEKDTLVFSNDVKTAISPSHTRYEVLHIVEGQAVEERLQNEENEYTGMRPTPSMGNTESQKDDEPVKEGPHRLQTNYIQDEDRGVTSGDELEERCEACTVRKNEESSLRKTIVSLKSQVMTLESELKAFVDEINKAFQGEEATDETANRFTVNDFPGHLAKLLQEKRQMENDLNKSIEEINISINRDEFPATTLTTLDDIVIFIREMLPDLHKKKDDLLKDIKQLEGDNRDTMDKLCQLVGTKASTEDRTLSKDDIFTQIKDRLQNKSKQETQLRNLEDTNGELQKTISNQNEEIQKLRADMTASVEAANKLLCKFGMTSLQEKKLTSVQEIVDVMVTTLDRKLQLDKEMYIAQIEELTKKVEKQEINERCTIETLTGLLPNEYSKSDTVGKFDPLVKVKTYIEHQKAENCKLLNEIQQLQGRINDLKAKLEQEDNVKVDAMASNNNFTKSNKDLKASLQQTAMLERKNTDLQMKLRTAIEETDEAKTRLSRMMSQKLTDNNPNIADLSDHNRPTKLAERFSQLYDNQWTDAFDSQEMQCKDDKVIISKLLHTLRETMDYCKKETMRQVESLQAALYLSSPQKGITFPMAKPMKEYIKAAGPFAAKNAFQEYQRELQSTDSAKADQNEQIEAYAQECFEVCWLMCIQDPPVVLGPKVQHGDPFNTNEYKPFTAIGPEVDYIVWPAVYLHQGGPLLSKGVAQGYGAKNAVDGDRKND